MRTQHSRGTKSRHRTPAQLERKRALNKARRRLKRHEETAEVQEMLQELRSLRTENQSLHASIQSLRHSLNTGDLTHCCSLQIADEKDLCQDLQGICPGPCPPTPLRFAADTSGSLLDNFCGSESIMLHAASPKYPRHQTPVAPSQPPRSVSGSVMSLLFSSPSPSDMRGSHTECVCRPACHACFEECFEETFYGVLIGAQYPTCKVGQPPPIPASPLLSDLLFLDEGKNPVTKILNRVLRSPRISNVKLSVLFGCYIIFYKLLRTCNEMKAEHLSMQYRLFPSLETFNDVPKWLRPTDAQINHPLPIFIDFIFFPQLRNAMACGKIDYVAAEFVEHYNGAINSSWPNEKSLIVAGEANDVILDSSFEAHALNLNSWTSDPVFVERCPSLAHLVDIKY
ncbi:uncharacterized protein N7479_000298 [Penicillium vulpinum]|uniref:uncharacterized protein n=1 Tax=Penicillium vulpinum TaxID=29845 RepID=UPI002546DE5F|nr:uncharacterized protein N7479_000298 [Penicillium vulpinum]KAJ5970380.1 hypothetical protein N7479_000298 [Penicillium vulpinum]